MISKKRPSSSTRSTFESMTGYSEKQRRISDEIWICKCKSLNSRGLDIKVKSNRIEDGGFELQIKKTAQHLFTRGTIEVFVSSEKKMEAATSSPLLQEAFAQQFKKALQLLEKNLSQSLKDKSLASTLALELLKSEYGLGSLLPAVSVKTENAHPAFEVLLEEIIEPALQELKHSRQDEGRRLLPFFEERTKNLFSLYEKISQKEGTMKKELPDRIRKRVESWQQIFQKNGVELPWTSPEFSKRLQEEVAFWLDRRDIEEEKHRLKIHLEEFEKSLYCPNLGKKMEFQIQEIFREINTLGNKVQEPQISQLIVDFKLILEQMKEQVANVS